MHPFRPLWIQPAVRFLILWLEYTYYFPCRIFDKVTTAGTLVYPLWINPIVYRTLSLPHQFRELWIIWKSIERHIEFQATEERLALPVDPGGIYG